MKKLSILLLSCSLVYVSCSKKSSTPVIPPTTANTSAPTPSFVAGDGFLVALNSKTKTTVFGIPSETQLGTGLAGFGNLTTRVYNSAGAITLNTKALTKNTNNVYYFTPSIAAPTGIDLSANINWNIAGAGTIPAFTHDASGQGMPFVDEINASSTTIMSTSDYTLSSLSGISNSDSVYFQIAGPSGVVLKRKGSNTGSALFTSAELATLGKGTGSMVIAPWNYTTKNVSGKIIYIVNETAVSKIIKIQ